ncbi:MAG TPA: hypothetical protein VLC98_13000 [Phnomibacter sp.]|nr:hypothetical protein [Phnomibacter sp.]
MKSKAAKWILGIVVLLLAGMGYAWYLWNKPARDAADEKGIAITAAALFEQYAANQQSADSLYLDKTLQVQGEIVKTGTNQQGQFNVELKTNQSNGTIFCTLKKQEALHVGSTVSLKGICKGYRDQMLFFDVVLVDCYLVP